MPFSLIRSLNNSIIFLEESTAVIFLTFSLKGILTEPSPAPISNKESDLSKIKLLINLSV